MEKGKQFAENSIAFFEITLNQFLEIKKKIRKLCIDILWIPVICLNKISFDNFKFDDSEKSCKKKKYLALTLSKKDSRKWNDGRNVIKLKFLTIAERPTIRTFF